MSPSGWIGVDLDGTLAYYAGWNDGQIGAPILPMVRRVKQWLAEGREVRIVTARVSIGSGSYHRTAEAARQRSYICDWCEKHIGRTLPITCTKDYAMVELWDDRAVQVIPNTGRRADGLEDEDVPIPPD